MEGIGYRNASTSWRVIKTKRKDGKMTQQWQLVIRWKEIAAEDSEGNPVIRIRRKTKLFPTSQNLNTEIKRRRAAAQWLEQFIDSQDKAVSEKRKKEKEEAARERERVEAEQRAKADRDAETLPSGRSPVGFYVDSYLDDVEASGSLEKSTMVSYRVCAKHITKGFTQIRLDELTPTMIQKWENSLIREGRNPSTVVKYHRLLSLVCKQAVIRDDLVKNPCYGVRVPKKNTPLPNSLTADGFAWLASTVESMEPTPLVVAAAIAVYTGMRQGEICGLRWREYDSEAQTIRVVEAIGSGQGAGYSKVPKTMSSRRIIPVAPKLAKILERRRQLMVSQLEETGVTMTADQFDRLYVIGYVDGRFHSPMMICRNWKAMSESFGLIGTQGRSVTFHDLRHSFATRAVAAGADIKAVSSVLGHTNAAMTLNVYADADPASKRRTTDLVQRAALAQPREATYELPV